MRGGHHGQARQRLGDQGKVLTAWEAARHLSQIVYGLPWQGEVKRALRHLND